VSSYRWSDEGLEGERLSGDVAVTDGVVATAGGAERAPGDGVYKPGVPVDVVVESVGAGACAASWWIKEALASPKDGRDSRISVVGGQWSMRGCRRTWTTLKRNCSSSNTT
jgi:hypothetical protein